jgi:membrane protein CcdC involved in cytochrome C biogenesis
MNGSLYVLSSIIALIMAVGAIFIRIRAAKKPASIKKIILPPLFMSTGFLMFLYPPVRVSYYEAFEALIVGALFSIVLIKTTKFEMKSDLIYIKRSKAFIVILVGLLLFRLVLKTYLGQQISYEETSGLLFILAFGMILPWRLSMVYSYRKLTKLHET